MTLLSRWLRGMAIAATIFLVGSGRAFAQQEQASPTEERSANALPKAGEAITKYFEVVRKRPRPGIPLTRLIEFYRSESSLDLFVASLKDRATSEKDGLLLFLAGMIEREESQGDSALETLKRTEALLPKDPAVGLYLGELCLDRGRLDEAVGAWERCLANQPTRADRLDVSKQLARLYQRLGRKEESRKLWNEIEASYGSDVRVLEEIISMLLKEGEKQQALQRIDALAKSFSDPQKQIEYRLKSADLRRQLGEVDVALKDLEGLLRRAKPDSWTYSQIRQRIEEILFDQGGSESVIAYYQRLCAEQPSQLGNQMRLVALLEQSGKQKEVEELLATARQRNPRSIPLRLAQVNHWEKLGETAKSIDELQQVIALEPKNAQWYLRLAQLQLVNVEETKESRVERATRSWMELTKLRPGDVATIIQVAELLRGIDEHERAISLYQQAVQIKGCDRSHVESLGEYLFSLKRQDEALAVWQTLVAVPRVTKEDWLRLGKIYSTYGFHDKAVEAIARALVEGSNASEKIEYASALRNCKRNEEAIKVLQEGMNGELSSREFELAMQLQIQVLRDLGLLDARIIDLREQVAGDGSDDAKLWQQLAILHVAAGNDSEGIAAIEKASTLEPEMESIRNMRIAMYRDSGRLRDAIELLEQQSSPSGSLSIETLRDIYALSLQIGDKKRGVEVMTQLVDRYRLAADTIELANQHFSNNQPAMGLAVLRKHVSIKPTDVAVLARLVESLDDYFETEEAIERAFDLLKQNKDFEFRKGIVRRLAKLGQRSDQLAEVKERLLAVAMNRSESGSESALLVASYLEATGSLREATELLERELLEFDRDQALLQGVVTLCEKTRDWNRAAEYQFRLSRIDTGGEQQEHLKRLLMLVDDEGLLDRILPSELEKIELGGVYLNWVDTRLSRSDWERASQLIDQGLAKEPNQWELLVRKAICHWEKGEEDAAVAIADRFLLFDRPWNEPCELWRSNLQGESTARVGQRPVTMKPNRRESFGELFSVLKRDSDAFRAMLNTSPGEIFGEFGKAANLLLAMKIQREQRLYSGETPRLDQWIETVDSPDSSRNQLWLAYHALVQKELSDFEASMGTKDSQAALIEKQLNLLEKMFFQGDELAGDYFAAICLGRIYANSEPGAPKYSSAWKNRLSSQPLSQSRLKVLRVLGPKALEINTPESWERLGRIILELDRAGLLEEANLLHQQWLARPGYPSPYLVSVSLARSEHGFIDQLLDSVNDRIQKNGEATSGYLAFVDEIPAIIKFANRRRDDKLLRKILTTLLACQTRMVSERDWNELTPLQMVVQKAAGGRAPSSRSIDSAFSAIRFPCESIFFSRGELFAYQSLLAAMRYADFESEVDQWIVAQNGNARTSAVADLLRVHGRVWVEGTEGERRVEVLEKNLSQMRRALSSSAGSSAMMLLYARYEATYGERSKAVEALQGIEVFDAESMRIRDSELLGLYIATGDLEQAKDIAKKLSGLALDQETASLLRENRKELELAAETIERIDAFSAESIPSGAAATRKLLQSAIASGDQALAQKIALGILKGKQSANLSQLFLDRFDYDSQAAIQVLLDQKQLVALIGELEAKLERKDAEGNVATQLLLIQLYRSQGEYTKSWRLMRSIPKENRGSVNDQISAAEMAYRASSFQEASDFYGFLIEEQPGLFVQNATKIIDAFARSGRIDELVDKLLHGQNEGKISLTANSLSAITYQLRRGEKRELFRKWITSSIERHGIASTMPGLYAAFPSIEARQLSDGWVDESMVMAIVKDLRNIRDADLLFVSLAPDQATIGGALGPIAIEWLAQLAEKVSADNPIDLGTSVDGPTNASELPIAYLNAWRSIGFDDANKSAQQIAGILRGLREDPSTTKAIALFSLVRRMDAAQRYSSNFEECCKLLLEASQRDPSLGKQLGLLILDDSPVEFLARFYERSGSVNGAVTLWKRISTDAQWDSFFERSQRPLLEFPRVRFVVQELERLGDPIAGLLIVHRTYERTGHRWDMQLEGLSQSCWRSVDLTKSEGLVERCYEGLGEVVLAEQQASVAAGFDHELERSWGIPRIQGTGVFEVTYHYLPDQLLERLGSIPEGERLMREGLAKVASRKVEATPLQYYLVWGLAKKLNEAELMKGTLGDLAASMSSSQPVGDVENLGFLDKWNVVLDSGKRVRTQIVARSTVNAVEQSANATLRLDREQQDVRVALGLRLMPILGWLSEAENVEPIGTGDISKALLNGARLTGDPRLVFQAKQYQARCLITSGKLKEGTELLRSGITEHLALLEGEVSGRLIVAVQRDLLRFATQCAVEGQLEASVAIVEELIDRGWLATDSDGSELADRVGSLTNASGNGRKEIAREERLDRIELAESLLTLDEIWAKGNLGAEQRYELWRRIVLAESDIERIHIFAGAIKDEAPGWSEVRSEVPERSERVRSLARTLVQLSNDLGRSGELRKMIDERLERQGCSSQAIPISIWLAAAMGDADRIRRDWSLWCRNVDDVNMESIDELTGDLIAEVERVSGQRAEFNSDLARLIDRSLKSASSSVAGGVSLDCVSASCLDRLLDRLAEEGREGEFIALATCRVEALGIQATASERELRIGKCLEGINAVLKAREREGWKVNVPIAR